MEEKINAAAEAEAEEKKELRDEEAEKVGGGSFIDDLEEAADEIADDLGIDFNYDGYKKTYYYCPKHKKYCENEYHSFLCYLKFWC